MLNGQYLPETLAKGRTIVFNKLKGGKLTPTVNDLRPITTQPVFIKVIESIIVDEL